MSATTKTTRTLNGIDVTQLHETVAAVQADSSLARFQFRADNRWVMGGENRSTIQGFYGAGREDASRTEPFVFTNGEPPVLLGANEGANPVEFLLHAMVGCVTTTLVVHAAARGIRIESIATHLEGELDVRGLMALDDAIDAGYESIRVIMDVKADAPDEVIDELIRFAQAHSPVMRSVARPVPVTVTRPARAEKPVRAA